MSETTGRTATLAELQGALKGKRRFTNVTLPVSGLTVRVQSLMAGEQSRYETAVIGKDGKISPSRMEDAEARLVIKCLVDDAGARLLSDMQVPEVAGWDGADLAYLYRQCAKHCGINRSADDLEKNSDATTSDVSPTS